MWGKAFPSRLLRGPLPLQAGMSPRNAPQHSTRLRLPRIAQAHPDRPPTIEALQMLSCANLPVSPDLRIPENIPSTFSLPATASPRLCIAVRFHKPSDQPPVHCPHRNSTGQADSSPLSPDGSACPVECHARLTTGTSPPPVSHPLRSLRARHWNADLPPQRVSPGTQDPLPCHARN